MEKTSFFKGQIFCFTFRVWYDPTPSFPSLLRSEYREGHNQWASKPNPAQRVAAVLALPTKEPWPGVGQPCHE